MLPGFKLPPKAGMAAPEESFEPEMEVEAEETPMHEEAEAAAVTITPESVCYRDEQQVCGNCSYMEASGECQALHMPVEPGAGCNLFQQGGM